MPPCRKSSGVRIIHPFIPRRAFVLSHALTTGAITSALVPTALPALVRVENVKRLFFKPNETAMQLHVPRSEHACLAETGFAFMGSNSRARNFRATTTSEHLIKCCGYGVRWR